MDKAKDRGMFVNDGSFMERFKQLQQEKYKKVEVPEKTLSGSLTSVTSYPKTVNIKLTLNFKANNSQKTIQSLSSGKHAFSLKQKSKLVSPAVKFDEDEDGDEKEPGNSSGDGRIKRPKLAELGASDQRSQADVVPLYFFTPLLIYFDWHSVKLRLALAAKSSSYAMLFSGKFALIVVGPCQNLAKYLWILPKLVESDPAVRKAAQKLASFVDKNGRQFEHVTRQKNPGDTPFKFLFDENCLDYKYYLYRLSEEQKAFAQSTDSQISQNGEASTPTASDPIAIMEFYMKKAAQEEKLRPPKPSKDEMPPAAALQASTKKGHHMGD